MSDILKCPFCNRNLHKGEDGIYSHLDYMTECKGRLFDGSEALWQELIRTRKVLDAAVDKLKGIKTYYDDSYADPHFVNWHIVAQRLANDADDAIKAITALEQKDK